MKQDSRCWYTGVHVGQGGEAAAPVAWALRGDPTDYTAKLRGAAIRREQSADGMEKRGTEQAECRYPSIGIAFGLLGLAIGRWRSNRRREGRQCHLP